MGTISIWHWVLVVLISLVWVVPVVKILRNAGYSGWWCLLAFVPLLNVIMLWVFAFSRWPNVNASRPSSV